MRMRPGDRRGAALLREACFGVRCAMCLLELCCLCVGSVDWEPACRAEGSRASACGSGEVLRRRRSRSRGGEERAPGGCGAVWQPGGSAVAVPYRRGWPGVVRVLRCAVWAPVSAVSLR